jgi:hypothetical protein
MRSSRLSDQLAPQEAIDLYLELSNRLEDGTLDTSAAVISGHWAALSPRRQSALTPPGLRVPTLASSLSAERFRRPRAQSPRRRQGSGPKAANRHPVPDGSGAKPT